MEMLWKIVAPIIAAILTAVSPMIKTELAKLMRHLYQMALNTSNPVDDMAVKLLADLISVDVSGITPTVSGAVTALPKD